MSQVEDKLITIDLPAFLINFKDATLSYAIPAIDASIQYMENVDSPLIFLLLILIFVQLLRTILIKTPSEVKQVGSASQNRQINKEIKDLKKELKSIQTMLGQLKTINLENAPKSAVNAQQSTKIIQLCKDSWQKRESIASEIMDWQLKIIKEVTKLKNKNRSSRSPSRQQISSSKQFSAQSKKSIASAIGHSDNHVEIPSKHLFVSQIKEKEPILKSQVKEQPQEIYVQQTVINVKIENQSILGGKAPSFGIEVHEFKKAKANESIETHDSILINNHAAPVMEQVREEKVEYVQQQKAREVPSLPKMPINLPRPPNANKKDSKRAPPPPIKAPLK